MPVGADYVVKQRCQRRMQNFVFGMFEQAAFILESIEPVFEGIEHRISSVRISNGKGFSVNQCRYYIGTPRPEF
jgi:predicted metalloprotease with PDZ domain